MNQILFIYQEIQNKNIFSRMGKELLKAEPKRKPHSFNCHRVCILLLFIFSGNMLSAQSDVHFSASDQVMVSSASHLPFWLWANQDGKVDPVTSFLNLTDLSANGTSMFGRKNGARFSYGATLIGGLEAESYLQVNRLFAAMDYRGWKLSAGMYYDEEILAGLSATNGNLARSRNFRPYPRIGLSTPDFKPLPFFRNWLRFKLEYDEGILNDQRYVMHTHLHHKAFYFKVLPNASWVIEAGIEHFVMWGGTSRNEQIGTLPSDFGAYLRYITGSSGNAEFPGTDQRNVAGNQYGTYQLQITKSWDKGSLTFYLSHPFEDLSGVNWRNYPDNLVGVHWHQNNPKAFLTDVLYEFTDTRQQGIIDTLYAVNEDGTGWHIKDYDNYYNNSVYRSGVTYHQMAMSSPLFAPVIINDGISMGFGANRLVSHHFGLKGLLTTGLYWKTLLTATRYLGTYSNPYVPEKNQLSGLLQFTWEKRTLPFDVKLAVAFDSGAMVQDAVGIQLGISKEW